MKLRILLITITVLILVIPIALGYYYYRDAIARSIENHDNYVFMSTQSAEPK